MSGSYDEASLAPEEITDSFWEVRLWCCPGPGDQQLGCVGTQAPTCPVALGPAPQPLGPLQSSPCPTGSGCHEVATTTR